MSACGLSTHQPDNHRLGDRHRQTRAPDCPWFGFQDQFNRPFHLFREQRIDHAFQNERQTQGSDQIDHNCETYSAGAATLLLPK